MYSALSVAHYIISYCDAHGNGISNLKLQKILYFVQAEFLVSTPGNRPCFKEQIEAWDFGPVVPIVYHLYKLFGSSVIPARMNDVLVPYYENISDTIQLYNIFRKIETDILPKIIFVFIVILDKRKNQRSEMKRWTFYRLSLWELYRVLRSFCRYPAPDTLRLSGI